MLAVARAPSLSYFDHPPLSFWIAGATARLAGSEQGAVVRLPFIVLFAGTTWLMYRLAARLFGERAGALAALLLNLSPVFSLSTGGWVLPDGPLMFAMLAAALGLERAIYSASRRRAAWWWVAAGVACGVAMLAKYHGVFLIVGTALFLLTTREQRRWLLRPEPYVATSIAFALFTPVLLWNARHAWVSFLYQSARGRRDGALHIVPVLEAIAGQALWILPWIWLPLVVLLVRAVRVRLRAWLAPARVPHPLDDRRWLLCCLALGPIVVFTLAPLRGDPGLPHWAAPGYLFLFPLLGAAVAERLTSAELATRRRARRWLVWSAASYVGLLFLAASQTATGWLGRAVPALVRHGDPSLEAFDWSELRAPLAAQGLLDAGERFVAATSWIQAGKIAHALGPAVPVLCLCNDPHHFPYIAPPDEYVGRDAVILQALPRANAATRYAAHFASIVPRGEITLHRAGHAEVVVAVFLARGFHDPLPAWEPR